MRGRDIKRYAYEFADVWLINTHNGVKEKGIKPINIDDYPAIKKHLDRFYSELEKRLDKGITPYNLRNCAYIEDFYRQKIVWAELARTGNAFIYDNSKSIVLNTSYILTSNNGGVQKLKYLLSILNSKLILFYMDLISSKLDKTGWRWLKQFVEQLPIPNYETENETISYLVNRVIDNKKNNIPVNEYEKQIDEIIYQMFKLDCEEIKFIEMR